jgi:hypothetical protein
MPIDHVTVRALTSAGCEPLLPAIGIETVYGGAHQDGATEMAMVSLPDGSYWELIAPQSQAAPHLIEIHTRSRFLIGDAGPCAWAFVPTIWTANSAASALTASLASALSPTAVRAPMACASPVGLPPAARARPAAFFPFLIQDLTARDRRAFPQSVPGNRGFQGGARVVLAGHNLDVAVARYRTAYDLAAIVKQTDPQFGAQLGTPVDASIVQAQPLKPGSWLAARLAEFGEAPCAELLDFAIPQPNTGATQSRYFDLRIRWFDSQVLGWRLGSA